MTREEALKKIKELENYIEELDNSVGYEDDILFLLSVEEYEKYKDRIPKWNDLWWLRSLGCDSYGAMCVHSDSSVVVDGYNVNIEFGVRPALNFSNFPILSMCRSTENSKRIFYKDFPFIIINEEKCIAISEVPIAIFKFSSHNSNDYETSDIRQFLLNWRRDYDF